MPWLSPRPRKRWPSPTSSAKVVAATAPLLHLVRMHPIKVVLSVPDRDLAALAPGAPVEVRDVARFYLGDPGQLFELRVRP